MKYFILIIILLSACGKDPVNLPEAPITQKPAPTAPSVKTCTEGQPLYVGWGNCECLDKDYISLGKCN